MVIEVQNLFALTLKKKQTIFIISLQQNSTIYRLKHQYVYERITKCVSACVNLSTSYKDIRYFKSSSEETHMQATQTKSLLYG